MSKMKQFPFRLMTALLVLAVHFSSIAQQTITTSITHDGQQRDYILYVPANYSAATAVPLILNYHGYGSSANAQMWYGDFRSIADTAGFIVAHPQGTVYQTYTHWNVGGWIVGSPADDVGFTSALIDSISATYNINAARIYSTGMSNGGFMSFLNACQLSDKIAAIASVGGSITPTNYNVCNPQRPVPVLQIHGTSDATVPYNGDTWTRSINDALTYWVGFNNTNPVPTTTSLPNINTGDGSTVEHIVYSGGDEGVTVEHMKITGGGHTWPGSAFGGAGTNYDINGSKEIWKFFSRYDINGVVGTPETTNDLIVFAYPNPTNDFATVQIPSSFIGSEYTITDNSGRTVGYGLANALNTTIDMRSFSNGNYFLSLESLAIPVRICKN